MGKTSKKAVLAKVEQERHKEGLLRVNFLVEELLRTPLLDKFQVEFNEEITTDVYISAWVKATMSVFNSMWDQNPEVRSFMKPFVTDSITYMFNDWYAKTAKHSDPPVSGKSGDVEVQEAKILDVEEPEQQENSEDEAAVISGDPGVGTGQQGSEDPTESPDSRETEVSEAIG